jgi:hypothetical protein
VEEVARAASQAVLRLSSQNQGEAVTAFEAYWGQRWTGGSGCLPEVAETARGLSRALDEYAGAVERAQLRIKELIAAVATAVVIGAVLTIVTVGVSDLAAGAVASSLVAAAAAVGVELSAEAAAIITAGVFATSLGVLEGGLSDLAIQGERVGYFHDQPSIDWNEVIVNAAVGGATAGAGFGATAAVPVIGRIAARLGGDVHAADAAKAYPAIRRGQLEELGAAVSAPQSEILKDPALLNVHLYQVRKYAEAGWQQLPNGNFRYYGEIAPAKKAGRMIGTRLVREWNPNTGEKLTWFETLDSHLRVRIIRPETQGPKVHSFFDEEGKYIGSK